MNFATAGGTKFAQGPATQAIATTPGTAGASTLTAGLTKDVFVTAASTALSASLFQLSLLFKC